MTHEDFIKLLITAFVASVLRELVQLLLRFAAPLGSWLKNVASRISKKHSRLPLLLVDVFVLSIGFLQFHYALSDLEPATRAFVARMIGVTVIMAFAYVRLPEDVVAYVADVRSSPVTPNANS